MEITAAVATDDLELAVNGLDGVGGGQGSSDGVGVFQERQVVIALFAEFSKNGIAMVKAFTKLFKLSDADLFTQVDFNARQGCWNSAPSVLDKWFLAYALTAQSRASVSLFLTAVSPLLVISI